MGDDEKPQELYSCNGCSELIPTDRARVACHTCPDYHLCANCTIIKQYTRPHVDSHTTMVLKLSGFVVPPPPGFPPRPAPALPPRQNSTINTRQTVRVSELPTANWGALWSAIKDPLEKMGKKSRKGSVDTTRGRSDSVMTGGLGDNDKGSNASSPLSQNPVNDMPPSPPKSVRGGINRIDSEAPSYPRLAEWESLFGADGTPTPIFVALMSTIFGHLDPEHTGYLTPEVYSAFLDVQGCESDVNRCKPPMGPIPASLQSPNLSETVYPFSPSKRDGKKTLGGDTTDSSKDMADLELGLYCSDHNISHILSVRTKTPTSPDTSEPPTSAVEQRIRQSISFKPNMPMLSRQGFIDLMTIEYLKDLDLAHEYLGRAVKEYGIWKELGTLPRGVLPEDSEAVEKAARVREVENTPETEGQSNEEEVELPAPALPIRPRGGEAKVDALMKGEGFGETEAAKPLPVQGRIMAIQEWENFQDTEDEDDDEEEENDEVEDGDEDKVVGGGKDGHSKTASEEEAKKEGAEAVAKVDKTKSEGGSDELEHDLYKAD
ncbi:uncharacterized protein PAC_15803 [Phialocephala subalpina]|uniref:ZZ-type domain-containing protein n=1 Tax=Phialocephala subalpina TaxID=576137 RepID=A0A1L7XLK3_9HELO|nr:uncharacterized protein PAC_15803 [Phialocephala subalpina]